MNSCKEFVRFKALKPCPMFYRFGYAPERGNVELFYAFSASSK
jgi:hypothetical protein